tara:strand:+ start:63 stop:506 length:444 start_codon:yes stop_codon:yes gene_type:complete
MESKIQKQVMVCGAAVMICSGCATIDQLAPVPPEPGFMVDERTITDRAKYESDFFECAQTANYNSTDQKAERVGTAVAIDIGLAALSAGLAPFTGGLSVYGGGRASDMLAKELLEEASNPEEKAVLVGCLEDRGYAVYLTTLKEDDD